MNRLASQNSGNELTVLTKLMKEGDGAQMAKNLAEMRPLLLEDNLF
jgi:hypothetical protein